MTETFRTLSFKGQSPILVIDPPDSFDAELTAMARETGVHRRPGKGLRCAFALACAADRAGTLEAGRRTVKLVGIRPVRQVAIDGDWSALRFRRDA